MSNRATYDVLGIGNALVDVISHESDQFVEQAGLQRGAMTLVDDRRARELYEAMGPGVEVSGGSAANTMVGLASFGARTAYIGKVRRDQLGEVFAHDLRATGVDFVSAPADDGPSTGRCLIVVTPDAQRTMSTNLGISAHLGPEDVEADLVADASVVYLEGYLWDQPAAKDAYRSAARIAHEADRKVALTLSDPFCVERHRADFRELVRDEVDLLFANHDEICALYECDFDDALQLVRSDCELAALTRSEHGSVLVHHDEIHVIDAHPVSKVVDTTGAGDLYAAGLLYGLTSGRDLHACGRLASIAAAEVIGHTGARPETRLADLV